ncbi:MAG: TonB-dependent receptor [Bacteroidales bacterium]|nr:TonB-dependent receptor [Bacteroidales bacterium]
MLKKSNIILLQEHDNINTIDTPTDRYNHLSLVAWDKPFENKSWGYYASYKIGAEWIDDKEAIVVTTKRGMEKIDFLNMFMTCFSSDLAIDSFSQIYSIQFGQPAIDAPSLKGVVSPLIVLHFLGVVNRIRTLKKGYVHYSGNLKKIKGHINILKNERVNITQKRFDRIYCEYDEYSVDIPENRILKKALLFSQQLLSKMKFHNSYNSIYQMLAKCISMFENVSSNVEIREIKQVKTHKLFKEYAEAVRLAKLVLKYFDYSIYNVSNTNNKVIPFVLDMSLLYEHYVYGLLVEAYKNKVTYQFGGVTGRPDFLYCSKDFKAILDTKYIPMYDRKHLDTHVIRQLSGYSRDLPILKQLGFEDICEDSPIPSVPCIIIYPKEDGENGINPFLKERLVDLCNDKVPKLSHFYKIPIPIPIIGKKRQ